MDLIQFIISGIILFLINRDNKSDETNSKDKHKEIGNLRNLNWWFLDSSLYQRAI